MTSRNTKIRLTNLSPQTADSSDTIASFISLSFSLKDSLLDQWCDRWSKIDFVIKGNLLFLYLIFLNEHKFQRSFAILLMILDTMWKQVKYILYFLNSEIYYLFQIFYKIMFLQIIFFFDFRFSHASLLFQQNCPELPLLHLLWSPRQWKQVIIGIRGLHFHFSFLLQLRDLQRMHEILQRKRQQTRRRQRKRRRNRKEERRQQEHRFDIEEKNPTIKLLTHF